MSLEPYRRKRDFARTPEPKGSRRTRGAAAARFVVHKHAARRTHYDLRLELGGVLKSWAVPKGPCLDPTEKRLAVRTEDHPVEYLEFERVIPAGSYGAGAMIIWDRGEWIAEAEDAAAALDQGELKFQLQGEKLQGRWMLVRWESASRKANAEQWLLIKERDEAAQPLAEGDVLGDFPHSVLSGLTVEELAALDAAPPRRREMLSRSASRRAAPTVQAAEIPQAKQAPMPPSVKPQLAIRVDAPPEGHKWLHEIKFDGYRLLASIDGDQVRLHTRHAKDWTDRFPRLVEALQRLPVKQALLDGEVVALLPSGVSSFSLLQSSLKNGLQHRLVYFAFDLLYLNGYDLRASPLASRKQALRELADAVDDDVLQYVDHVEQHGPAFFEECRRMGLEGVVSKRRDRPWRAGRTAEWTKAKCSNRDEFVIGGFTDPEGTREGLGALLLGYYDERGDLVYAGKVGTGFDQRTLLDLRSRLGDLERRRCPFRSGDRDKLDRGVHWVKPELVAQVQYANWTGEGLLWHPVYQGLREDRPAASVVRPAEGASRAPRATPPHAATANRRRALSDSQLSALSDVRLTSPDKVMYAEPRLTKLDLVRYYVEIAEWLLPHLRDRPLSLVRCPNGQSQKCFFQKHPMRGLPDSIRRVALPDDGEEYLAVDHVAGLAGLVQIGVLEVHPWGARIDRIQRPDRLIFDLDPAEDVPWRRVIDAALEVRALLEDAGLTAFVKTTGGKGLHVVVPIQRRHEWDEAKEFTRAVAVALEKSAPKQYTTSASKKARIGRIYIDDNRNTRGATAVAPYSTRNRPGAPVAVPVSWDELPDISPDRFTVENVPPRLAALQADPWEELPTLRQSITARARERFGLS